MALVVFLRGVNVGKHKRFQPALLARQLAHLGVVSVGAAGTFVVRGSNRAKVVRAEVRRRLPFPADLMICSAREVIDLVTADPFPDESSRKDTQRFVCVLAKRPRKLPPLPLSQPAGAQWQVKIIEVRGNLALCLWRWSGQGRTMLYPNEVVEKHLGGPATTRNWNTIVKLHDILKEPAR